jgi:hypothetical protein
MSSFPRLRVCGLSGARDDCTAPRLQLSQRLRCATTPASRDRGPTSHPTTALLTATLLLLRRGLFCDHASAASLL